MRLEEITQLRTEMSRRELEDIPVVLHESCFRSYHIVQKMKKLLAQKTPHDVMAKLLAEMEGAQGAVEGSQDRSKRG